MPSAPLRPCAEPGCANLVSNGRCKAHRQTYEVRRGSRIARGYDKHWMRIRAWFVSQPENQLCRMCQAEGIVRRYDEIDHIVPFTSEHDPNRLDPANLQPLCIDHHRAKTASQQRHWPVG